MSLKFRLLLAVLLTLIAIGSQVALAQTKTVKKNFIIANEASCNCNVSISPTLTNPTACNLTNGSVTLAVTGGSGSLTYQWKDPSGTIVSTSKDLINVGTGYYFLEVKDTNAPYCGTYYSNYTLTSNLNVAATVKDNAGCATANGAISITASGGSGTFSYSWRYPDGTVVNTKNITGVKAGTYYLSLTDKGLGCSITRSFSIRSTSALTLTTASTTDNTSCTTPNGSISILTAGGSGQYNYIWYDMQTYGVASTSKDLTGARGGSYAVSLSDKISGCVVFQYFTVAEQAASPLINVSELTPNTRCRVPFNGSSRLEISGTPGPYEVNWTLGTEVISTDLTPVDLAPGIYGVTVTDQLTKCKTVIRNTDPSPIEVLDHSKPGILLTTSEVKDNTSCSPSNGKIEITLVDPTTPYSIQWSGPDGFSSTSEDISALAPGDYELQITAGCNNPPVIEPSPLTLSQSKVNLDLTSIISDPDNNLDVSSIAIIDPPQSLAKASITKGETLQIDYTGTHFKGTDKLRIRACDLLKECTENLLTIEVSEGGDVIVFNAIAPNSDGDNKFMRIENLPDKNKVYIFNRWGDVVFKVDQYDHDNPGKRFEGLTSSGKALPSGTYLYKIELEGNNPPVTGYLSLKQ